MLDLKKISKSYGDKRVLKNLNVKFREKEFVIILGESGSGKSTLLNIIGSLDNEYLGDVLVNGEALKSFKTKDLDIYRNSVLGFVFQDYNLIPHISVLANVELALTLSGVKKEIRRRKAKEVLESVGLVDHINKKPTELSGGQRQRVAIARAIVNNPKILICDEPTGALDSHTSVQIMEILKKIAKDKLVIMVTHNKKLAFSYASRIIEMQDGKIISDSNSCKDDEIVSFRKIKKTAMSFFTAISLSLTNILTKKMRVLLTAFASSIGMIGIALIVSLASGFNKQIDNFEKNTLISLPIVIGEDALAVEDNKIKEKVQDEYIYGYTSNNSNHNNIITKDLITYLDKASPLVVSGISYTKYTDLKLIQKLDNKYKLIDSSNINISSIPKKLDSNSSGVIDDQYDLLKGRISNDKFEVMLVVGENNSVDNNILEALGFSSKVSFDEVINSNINLVLNDNFYKKIGDYYAQNKDLELLYVAKSIKLRVVGILKLKDEYPSYLKNSGILYSEDLINYIIENNSKSDIVMEQRDSNYNLLTGESFKDNNEKKMLLSYLGDSSDPYYIMIYPRNFQAKDKLLKYLDNYNVDKDLNDKIIYTDQAKLISSLSSSIMNSIAIVLIFFSSISLVVSLIMIGIITYISVLERKKEIGILRSIGARKKDISRVFNAENLLIGLVSSLISIVITNLLIIPVNKILYEMTSLKNIAVCDFSQIFMIVFLSILIAVLGGLIPAKGASKKNLISCLRSE